MNAIQIGTTAFVTSRLAYGCWRIANDTTPKGLAAGKQAVIAAYEAGYTLFDHADIYCDGEAEKVFGQALRKVSGMRERVVIASKCGIRKPGEPKADSPYRYDFSAVLESVKPKFFIQGDRDDLGPYQSMRAFYAKVPGPKELVTVDGADHLFDGKVSEVAEAVEDLLAGFSGRTIE